MKILITHQKGGVGKTTLTIALAKYFNSEKISVAIVDNDSQGSVTQFESIYKEQGINVYHLLSKEEIETLNEEVVLIDTPPYLFEQIGNLSSIIDIILVPTKASVLDLLAINRTIEVITEAKAEDKTFIVFNMINKQLLLNKEIRQEIEELGVPILDNFLSETVEYKNLILDDFKYKSKRQIKKLVDELIYKLSDKK